MKTLYTKTKHMGQIYSHEHDLPMIEESIDHLNHLEVIPDQEKYGDIYDDYDVEDIEEGKNRSDAKLISIENVEKYLEVAKAKGATHVSIDYHSDHVGYDIYMAHMREATQDEIDAYLKSLEDEEQEDKQRLIDELESKLARLKKS